MSEFQFVIDDLDQRIQWMHDSLVELERNRDSMTQYDYDMSLERFDASLMILTWIRADFELMMSNNGKNSHFLQLIFKPLILLDLLRIELTAI